MGDRGWGVRCRVLGGGGNGGRGEVGGTGGGEWLGWG